MCNHCKIRKLAVSLTCPLHIRRLVPNSSRCRAQEPISWGLDVSPRFEYPLDLQAGRSPATDQVPNTCRFCVSHCEGGWPQRLHLSNSKSCGEGDVAQSGVRNVAMSRCSISKTQGMTSHVMRMPFFISSPIREWHKCSVMSQSLTYFVAFGSMPSPSRRDHRRDKA